MTRVKTPTDGPQWKANVPIKMVTSGKYTNYKGSLQLPDGTSIAMEISVVDGDNLKDKKGNIITHFVKCAGFKSRSKWDSKR